jgi:hypothetical protein
MAKVGILTKGFNKCLQKLISWPKGKPLNFITGYSLFLVGYSSGLSFKTDSALVLYWIFFRAFF